MSIPAKDQKLLWARSGNRCAFPGCLQLLTEGGGSSGLVVGEMAHIYGEKPDAARYHPEVPSDSLNSYDNLILMCPTHHTLIDKDAATYTVAVLRQMKKDQEGDASEKPTETTEFAGRVAVKAKDGDCVTGAKISRPTRIKAGSSFTVETENVKNVTGLHIGGDK